MQLPSISPCSDALGHPLHRYSEDYLRIEDQRTALIRHTCSELLLLAIAISTPANLIVLLHWFSFGIQLILVYLALDMDCEIIVSSAAAP